MSNEIEVSSERKTIMLSEIPWRDYLASKNYDQDLNNMCRNCQSKQIEDHGKITIKCNGLAKIENQIDPEHLHLFTEEEIHQLKMIGDPYYWADESVDIDNKGQTNRMFARRWYQEQIVSCTAARKAIRCGRRTGKSYSLALAIAHRMVMNDNYKVLIVTPYEVQAEELAELIRTFLRKLDPTNGNYDTLKDRDVRSPNHMLTLQNGSRFRAFTTGSSGAASVRGQSADWIVLDEVDYMDQKDFNSILAILADKPDTELTVTSTPDGEKILYKLANDPTYKEFHFPTFVLPHYTDSLDNDFKTQTDSTGYIQEIMAEFGTASNAVFQSHFVDLAAAKTIDYSRDYVLRNRERFILILGCDWNDDKVGTRICTLAYDKELKIFFVAQSDNVQKDGWTQVKAIEKIKELNRHYVYDYIYVDEGFGSTQVQVLKQYAQENYGILPFHHPDLRLDDIVPVNFSSAVELKDLVNGEVRKKYFKNYMVESTVRVVENGQLVLDKKLDKDLIAQMKNYSLKSRSANGRAVYEASKPDIGDHDLDAFMIAIVGFVLEFDGILNTSTSSFVQFAIVEKSQALGYNQDVGIRQRISNSELEEMGKQLFHSYKQNAPMSSRSAKLSSNGLASFGDEDINKTLGKGSWVRNKSNTNKISELRSALKRARR